MILTQEQANAIAEREFPDVDIMHYGESWYDRAVAGRLSERAAYAKCLMDMNPLLEAANELSMGCSCSCFTVRNGINEGKLAHVFGNSYQPIGSELLGPCQSCRSKSQWDTALSNLTKKNDHEDY